MDTISASALSRQLDTSVPRVMRAVERLGFDARQANGRLGLTRRQADRVRAVLGVSPRAPGLTRPETMVLAALRSAPLGLVSGRAVSRRSGLSPTAAMGALEALLAKRLVVRTSETIAAGRAREAEIWRANVTHPHWAELDPILDRVERPERPEPGEDRVPRHLRHLFWNTAESQLHPSHAGAYIARRLLQTMDLQGLAWGARALKPDDWRRGAKARGLDPGVKRLAQNLADAPPQHGTLGSSGAARVERVCTLRGEQLVSASDVAGLQVASLHDLMAMKIKVMAERGEMRDYFDVMAIDEKSPISVEEGIELYVERYGVNPSGDSLTHLYRAMGDLGDVEVDELLPIGLAELQTWWSRRQVKVLRNSSRFG